MLFIVLVFYTLLHPAWPLGNGALHASNERRPVAGTLLIFVPPLWRPLLVSRISVLLSLNTANPLLHVLLLLNELQTGQRLGAIHDISGVLLPDVRITL